LSMTPKIDRSPISSGAPSICSCPMTTASPACRAH
jgi:hypothetical protein